MATRLKQFLDTGNLFRFLVALILAFALWAWVTSEQDPEISRLLPAVPVTAVNVQPGLSVVGTLGTVEISLQGPRSRINALEEGDVRATVNLGDIQEPGLYQVEVKVQTPPGVRVRRVVPDTVTVQLEPESAARPSPPRPVG
ncbi:MAG: CdaR family protein [Sphaerobacter sp.]|nr:CdaR family protein [Sphaerobacter sp.]